MAKNRNRTRGRLSKGGRPRSEPRQKDPWEVVRKMRQVAMVGEGGAPEHASYPLGTMLSRNIINQDQHNVGVEYARLYARFVGRARDCGVDVEGGSEPNEEVQAAAEQKYRAVRSALMAAGRRATDATDNACVYSRFPRWLDVASYNAGRREADARDRDALMDGLNALVGVLVGRRAA